MKNYKQIIEREAVRIYTKKPYWIGSGNSLRLYDENYTNREDFKKGINSELNAKILEIEKRKYALNEFRDLRIAFTIRNVSVLYLDNKISRLESEITSLQNEIK